MEQSQKGFSISVQSWEDGVMTAVGFYPQDQRLLYSGLIISAEIIRVMSIKQIIVKLCLRCYYSSEHGLPPTWGFFPSSVPLDHQHIRTPDHPTCIPK